MEPKPDTLNAAQIELWNGRGGEIWTRLQTRLDHLFEPLTAALLGAAAPEMGQSVLEIGCGCGDLTLRLAQACGAEGQVTAIDISTPMLERAKTRERDARAGSMVIAPIKWIEADAMLHRFEPLADLIVSRFGVMFFADPVEAFSNMRRALKPGGKLAVLCWAALEDNPWITVPLAAVHELIEPPPPLPANAPGPFAFADMARVEKTLSEAGFSSIQAQTVEAQVQLGAAAPLPADPLRSALDAALILALESGPVANLLRGANEITRQQVSESIASALKCWFDPGKAAVALPARCCLYKALSV